MNKQNRNILKISFVTVFIAAWCISSNAQESPWMRRSVVSPGIQKDRTVTFRVFAPASSSITVSGNWMDGWGAAEPLVKNDTGLWSLTVGPLDPEIYTYSFNVDGIRILDPSNPRIVRDGARHESMLFITGEATGLYAVNNVPHGTLSKVWYQSPTLNLERRLYLYTPPGYENSKEKYPVLYLLHGGGGDEDAWATLGRACQIMDNLIAQGRARPMIVVMTNGNPDEAAAPGAAPPKMEDPGTGEGISGMGSGRFEESLVKDVIPFVEGRYRTLTGKANRAVSGLSMGGMQTMNLAFDYSDMFDYFGVMSMGITPPDQSGRNWFPDVDKRIENLRSNGYKLYWIGCGSDDFLHEAASNLVSKMKENNLKFTYRETTGGHTWSNWRIYLSELAPLLFK
jgi:enterochelin esterase-like enzyme